MKKVLKILALELLIVFLAAKFAGLAALYETTESFSDPRGVFVQFMAVGVGLGNLVYICFFPIFWTEWINRS